MQPVTVEVEATPPETSQADDARSVAAGSETVEEGADGTRVRYVSGVSLNQIDEINRLIETIRAHGDVVSTSDDAGFADHSLSILGDAIRRDAVKLRDIIRDVDAQRLGQVRGARTGVRETQAIYHVLPARVSMGRVLRVPGQLSTYAA